MEAGKSSSKVNVSGSTSSHTLQNLKKWTVYFIKIAISNGDFLGPPSPEKKVRTLEDGLYTPWLKLVFYKYLFFPLLLPEQETKNLQKGSNWLSPLSLPFFFHLAPSKPLNLSFTFQKPSEIAMLRMTVHWHQPAEQNGIIRKYRLVLTYTIDGRQTTITSEKNNQTFSHSLDVFGGVQYSVEIWAETIKPGPTLTGTIQVPEYSKYLLSVSCSQCCCISGPLKRWCV